MDESENIFPMDLTDPRPVRGPFGGRDTWS